MSVFGSLQSPWGLPKRRGVFILKDGSCYAAPVGSIESHVTVKNVSKNSMNMSKLGRSAARARWHFYERSLRSDILEIKSYAQERNVRKKRICHNEMRAAGRQAEADRSSSKNCRSKCCLIAIFWKSQGVGWRSTFSGQNKAENRRFSGWWRPSKKWFFSPNFVAQKCVKMWQKFGAKKFRALRQFTVYFCAMSTLRWFHHQNGAHNTEINLII